MSRQDAIVERIEYRLILVVPESRKVLGISTAGGYRAPFVSIAPQTRQVMELQSAIRTIWNVNALILDVLPATKASTAYAVAEVLHMESGKELRATPFAQLMIREASEEQRMQPE